MFGGAVLNGKIELLSDRAIGVIYEWFGKNTSIVSENGKMVAYIKADEQSIAYWALQYAELVKVISPETVVSKIKLLIDTLKKNYE